MEANTLYWCAVAFAGVVAYLTVGLVVAGFADKLERTR